MKLYGYWRSSAAYRVRIAMHIKGINFESIPVHLVKEGGEQHKADYVAMNPTHLVPTLVDGDLVLNQSMAIIDYLEQKYPSHSLYPDNIEDAARVRAMALDIACEVHPLNNLRVQQYLVKELGVDDKQKMQWVHDWMHTGFAAYERQLEKFAGDFSFGNRVSVADLCLVPQVYNANRFDVDMSAYPLITKVVENCLALSAFDKAVPENQADAT
ncbi:maleylacetoacetate isomerase [Thalassotalea euphylliae]|uniref:maleylacetoacetate isomerase n=1 Tax=Thalassotalea euphylliae TaxID=1655234 RepID=UPI003630E50B